MVLPEEAPCSCRLKNKVRMFKLLAMVDEYAYVSTSKYLACLHRLHMDALVRAKLELIYAMLPIKNFPHLHALL